MDPSTIASVDDMVVLVPLDQIAPNPYNPPFRMNKNRESNKELAASIVQEATKRERKGQGPGRGVLEPITIHPVPPELAEECKGRPYVCGDGHRRLGASITTEQPFIRCLIEQLSAAEILRRMIVQNDQREAMPPCAEARQIQRLMALGGYTQAQVAEELPADAHGKHRKQAWVAKRLALLDNPRWLQDEVDAGELSVNSAYELRRLVSNPPALKLVRQQTRGQNEVVVRDAVDAALAELGITAKDGRGRKRALLETARLAIRRAPRIYVPPEQRVRVFKKVRVPGPLYAQLFGRMGMKLHPWLEEVVQEAMEQKLRGINEAAGDG